MLHPVWPALSGTCPKCWKVLGQPPIQLGPTAHTARSSQCQRHVFSSLKKQLKNSHTKMSRLWQYSGSSNRPEKNVWKHVCSELYIKSSVLYIYHEGTWGTWGVASHSQQQMEMVSFTSQPFNFQRKGSQHLMNGRLGELQI